MVIKIPTIQEIQLQMVSILLPSCLFRVITQVFSKVCFDGFSGPLETIIWDVRYIFTFEGYTFCGRFLWQNYIFGDVSIVKKPQKILT